LANLEKSQCQALLKSGQASSQRQAGEFIGLQERQSQRIWQLYRQGGLRGLMSYPYQGTFGKLSSEQLSHLRTYLKGDSGQTLADAQRYWQESCSVHYTISGVRMLFKRLKIKLKTGRPTNVGQQQADLEAFKKTFLPSLSPTASRLSFRMRCASVLVPS
jgi:transposase